MLLVNHWLQKIEFGSILIPNREQCTKTNSNKQIVRHMDSCRASWGKTPNFILVSGCVGLQLLQRTLLTITH